MIKYRAEPDKQCGICAVWNYQRDLEKAEAEIQRLKAENEELQRLLDAHHQPNATTLAAIDATDRGEVETYNDAEEMFASMEEADHE